MTFRVDSEVGRLRQVDVHRPGTELSRLTPRNVHDLLFDDILWVQRVREEHHLFQRDNCAWIYGGVSINSTALPARLREFDAA
jgi:arginine deiminase